MTTCWVSFKLFLDGCTSLFTLRLSARAGPALASCRLHGQAHGAPRDGVIWSQMLMRTSNACNDRCVAGSNAGLNAGCRVDCKLQVRMQVHMDYSQTVRRAAKCHRKHTTAQPLASTVGRWLMAKSGAMCLEHAGGFWGQSYERTREISRGATKKIVLGRVAQGRCRIRSGKTWPSC